MDLRLTSTGDIDLSTGDLLLLRGADAIAQRIRIRLRLFAGEWFLAPTAGVPYFEQILGHKISRSTLEQIFREQILATPGVRDLEQLTVEADGARRTLRISFTAIADSGDSIAAEVAIP